MPFPKGANSKDPKDPYFLRNKDYVWDSELDTWRKKKKRGSPSKEERERIKEEYKRGVHDPDSEVHKNDPSLTWDPNLKYWRKKKTRKETPKKGETTRAQKLVQKFDIVHQDEFEEGKMSDHWYNQDYIIKQAYYQLIEESGGTRAPSKTEIAKRAGCSVANVSDHIKSLRFKPIEHPLRVLTDDVLLAIANSAKAGNSGSQKLWLQVMEGWSESDTSLERDAGLVVDKERDLQNEILKEFIAKSPVLEMVLQRVSLRRKVSPLYLLYKLKSSFYATKTGMETHSNTPNGVEFPSETIFDFDHIKKQAPKKEQEDREAREDSEEKLQIVLTPEKKERVLSLKERAILRLKEMRKQGEGEANEETEDEGD